MGYNVVYGDSMKTEDEIEELFNNAVNNQHLIRKRLMGFSVPGREETIGVQINILGKLIIDSIDRLTAAVEKLTPKE